MLYREIMAVCSEIHTKHTNTLRGQNVEFLSVKPGGTYSDHYALKGFIYKELYTSSPHRAVNTLRLGYKSLSVNVVYGNNRCVVLRSTQNT